jgi:predicted nucleic acid-binding protein
MIVLDTNVLERHPFESPVMAILKVLSRLTSHKLAISEVTLNERCSHFRNQLQRGFEQQARIGHETAELLRIANTRHKSWSFGSETQVARMVEIALGKYQQRLLGTFDVVELDGASAIEALRREACRLPPASISFDAKGTGARDAAIWLSLVREARSGETVYLVSSDKKAFHSADLSSDLTEGSSVMVLNDVADLIEALADVVDVDINIEQIRESEEIRHTIQRDVFQYGILSDVAGVAASATQSASTYFVYRDPVTLEFADATNLRGHIIGGDGTWVTGRARWKVGFPIQFERTFLEETRPDTTELWSITFEFVSVLLFRASEEGIGSVEVVDVGKPLNITTQLDEVYPSGPDSFWARPLPNP